MAYGLYKADQLALIGGDLEMSSCKWPAEEGDGISRLMQHGSKT
jgi:hypothetical protein